MRTIKLVKTIQVNGRVFHDKDDGRVWRAIDWRDNFDVSIHGEEVSPSDEEFKAHFESILNTFIYINP